MICLGLTEKRPQLQEYADWRSMFVTVDDACVFQGRKELTVITAISIYTQTDAHPRGLTNLSAKGRQSLHVAFNSNLARCMP
jgi:hypothetical protein